MKKLLFLLLLTSCTIEQPTPQYKEGDVVFIKPNHVKAVVDAIVPGGYLLVIATKYDVNYAYVTAEQISK